MSLVPGSVVGRYRILARLGDGGMGVVFRAQDTTLGREVALKVLREDVASDPDRCSRFEREARVLASLNHPNIATLHGLSRFGDRHILEMELVPGLTLRERLAQGQIPLDEALPIASQIAQALEAAHERGIVHRDLKPANIKVQPDGRVKVLDFGLAKALDDAPLDAEVTHSPASVSGPSRAGVLLGTLAYMSPEQARGRFVDRRADIWAFGCVLYEVLSGRGPFRAETGSDTLAAILKEEPDWDALGDTPQAIGRLVRRCLQKDPAARLRDIADARFAIEEVLQDHSAVIVRRTERAAAVTARRRARLLPAVAILALAGGIGIAAWRFMDRAPDPGSQPQRVVVPLQPQQRLAPGPAPAFAIAPDGRTIVYAALTGGARAQLYVRPVDRFDAVPIQGTEGGTAPFFSPDGRWVGFYAGDALQKVALDGGAPLEICDAPSVVSATWGADDTILFSTTLTGEGLWRVPAAGGTPEAWTTPDADRGELRHAYPQLLPDGRHLLFTVIKETAWHPAVLSMADRTWRTIDPIRMDASAAQFVASGHLVFAQPRGLVAIAFDPARAEVRGSLASVAEAVDATGDRPLPFAVSLTGSLLYLPANASPPARTLVLVDAEGRPTPLTDARAGYAHPRFSRDGRWLAVAIDGPGGSQIWIHDLRRGTRTLTGSGGTPAWSHDSTQVAFHAPHGVPWQVFARVADGSLPALPLLAGPRPELPDAWGQSLARLLPGNFPALTGANPQFPMSWSRDGVLAFTERKPNGERDIWLLETGADTPFPFALTPADEASPAFSHDGLFLAYTSDESGQHEVYVQPYPGPGGRWPISLDGGTEPVWSADGREIYYRQGDRVMAVSIERQPEFSAGVPRLLFEARYDASDLARNYDVSTDGRFVMVRGDDAPTFPRLHLVTHWGNDLLARAPAR